MPLNIHLIFKTHLDVGFTNYARVVTAEYFNRYIPSAIQLARQRRESGQGDRFIWTTGSWLIYEYLEHVDAAKRTAMEVAIAQGDIAWHALPFTTHSESMDADLFRLGLSLSQRLDMRFGKHTIAAKFTDVPGHTRGIVPLLAEAGVKFLQVGVNGGSAVPTVPPLFRWRDPSGSELIVMYAGGYGSTFVLPGTENALAFGHSMDNLGPQTETQVAEIYRQLRAEHPGAHIFASTLNTFAEKLLPVWAELPIVTQEIGDSWIHGIGSDPIKVSQFRELLRLRSDWLKAKPSLVNEPAFDLFQRRLLMVPEHTWGMDEKTFLGDHKAYSSTALAAARGKDNFRAFEASWAEKRAYIASAVEALGSTPRSEQARSRLAALQPGVPSLAGWKQPSSAESVLDLPGLAAQFDLKTGALIAWQVKPGGKFWADGDHPLGLLRYQTFSADDYERFFRQYIRPEEQNNDWSREDFTKPGLENAHPVSRYWQPVVVDGYQKDNACLFHLTGEPESVSNYGCPRDFYLKYTFNQAKPELEIDLQWFNKQACRMPEALWFSFIPRTPGEASWSIDKLGQDVSPLDVVENGNRHLHASGQYVRVEDAEGDLTITALDSTLVAPGEPSLLNFHNGQPDMTRGVHFNLYNNLWGTNFPMWFEEDCRFRFVIRKCCV